MNNVIGLTPEIQQQLDNREAAQYRRANRFRNLRNRFVPIVALTALAGVAAHELASDEPKEQPAQVVICVGEDQITGTENTPTTPLTGQAHIRTLPPHATEVNPNQYIRIDGPDLDNVVAGLGACATFEPVAIPPTPRN